MKFKEVQQADGTIKYYMGQNYKSLKEVPENTYKILIEDDNTSDNVTTPKINMSEIEGYSECGEEDGEFCEECQGILDLIFDLSEMDERDAIDTFKDIMYKNRQEAFLEGMIEAYTELGNLSHKISSRIENQLEDCEE